MSHNNAYNIFLRKDIDKRFSESESTINFASGNGQFRNITNFKEITIFSEAFHLNQFLINNKGNVNRIRTGLVMTESSDIGNTTNTQYI